MRLLQGILLSLAIHLFLLWGSQFLPVPSRHETERIEIAVLPASPVPHAKTGPDKNIVRQTVLPNELLTQNNEEAHFFSAERQRVKKQMRASQSGMTANRGADQAATSARETSRPSSQQKNTNLLDLAKERTRPNGGLTVPQAHRTESASAPWQGLPPGFSTVGESLPQELEVGSFTSLNTDRYLFYSFYSRIEELIRWNWENAVKRTIQTTPRSQFQRNLRSQWVTQIEIQLQPNGQFHRALLLKSSSLQGFDDSAIAAFVRAQTFPNPPREMVEDDGLIHLQYQFTVDYTPRAIVEKPDHARGVE